ncbi:hypothetical protein SAMN05216167_10461 [Spirosoma endophyticum]|uniref:Uncharacterized protein n=1 Tax=Spirosoma endophyticum TaxID=662367 RepID=A0A1I1QQ54_9BACT|nr:hypothetical protein SAMN05216167_10461 [Spirosoma endophyticum]
MIDQTDFLFLFKAIFLLTIPSSDELVLGIVVIISILSGFLVVFADLYYRIILKSSDTEKFCYY